MQDPLVYQLDVAGFAFQIRTVSGVEGLSLSWRFELAFVLDPQTMSGDPDAFDPDVVIKAKAVLTLRRGDVVVRTICGIVTEAALSGTITGHAQVRLVVEPGFALLKHRKDVRIHRNLSVPEIAQQVAAGLGVKSETRLRESYAKRPYCVQWRESDFDYVSRLLEDEGIFYFFTQDDTLVLGDHRSAYGATGLMLPFRSAAGVNQNDDAVHALGTRAAVTPGKVTLRDWNTEHPNLDMDVSHATAVTFGPEWYDFPGEFEDTGEGKRKARLHAEAFDSVAAAVLGRSTAGGLMPGYTFALSEAPVGGIPGEHVVRQLTHAWDREQAGFELVFEADAGDAIYRPARATHVPRIMNPLTGIVCTNGEDIHCDHFGRVKVHFHWDRLRPFDDDCSHWVPVLQDNTGGSSAIPRKDWEVVVHFLEGDPDRPVVLGRVYNGDDVFQEKLPYAKARSALTSRATPDRITGNEIRFDDAAGAEQIFVRAPKDMNVFVGNDQTQSVGNSATSTVGNDETVSVGGNSTWKIGADYSPTVGANQKWEVGGNYSRKVGLGDVNAVGGDHELRVVGDHTQTVFSDVNYGAKNLREDIQGKLAEEFKVKHTTAIGGPMELTIGGGFSQKAKSAKMEQTTRDRTESITGTHSIVSDDELQLRCFTERTSTIGAAIEVRAGKILALTGAEKHTEHSKTASWTGSSDVTLVVTDGGVSSTVMLTKDGQVTIRTDGTVTIDVTGTANLGAKVASQI